MFWLAYQYVQHTIIFYHTMPAKVSTNATTNLTYLVDLQEGLLATGLKLVDYWPVTAKKKSSKHKVFIFCPIETFLRATNSNTEVHSLRLSDLVKRNVSEGQ